MKVAIVGSRNINIEDIGIYIPIEVTEIVSGGAKGVDACAKKYAIENNIKFTEFLPEYSIYGKFAPLKRNLKIIDYSDIVIAFWNGSSKGTKYTIDKCKQIGKRIVIHMYDHFK